MMDSRASLHADDESSIQRAARKYLIHEISGVYNICQNLLDDIDGVVESIKDQDLRDADTETFFTIAQSNAKLWKSRSDRLISLAGCVEYGETSDTIFALLEGMRWSLFRMQHFLEMSIKDFSLGTNTGCAFRPGAFPSADAEANKSSILSQFESLKEELEGYLNKTLQCLQDRVLLLDLDDQKEFQVFLTQLLLWTGYEWKLFETLLKGSVSGAVLAIIRKVLVDPSRLTKLQRRMIDANCLRRGRLIKARSYANRLKLQSSEKASKLGSIGISHSQDVNQSSEDFEGMRLGFTATRIDAFTMATSLGLDNHHLKLSTIRRSDINFPKPPVAGKDTAGVICPFCSHHLPIETVSIIKNWRHHVLQDVLPYTCVFDKCPTPFVFYPSTKRWLAHMEKEHSDRQWICYGCSPSEPRVFDNLHDYVQHFETTRQHVGVTTGAQIEALVRLNETPRPLRFTSCPLCRWSEYSELNSFAGTTMLDHIADHVFSFAMQSLLPDAKQDSESRYSSRTSNHAVDNDSDRSFELDSLSSLGSHGVVSDNYSKDIAGQNLKHNFPAPLVASENSGAASFRLRESHSSGLLISRWRKALLLSAAIASFLAAGRRIRSESMCRYCRTISDFFQNLDVKKEYKEFRYHYTRQDIYISARIGCSLCKMFIKAAFGESDESDYEELESKTQDEAASFSIAFSGRDKDKKLIMWESNVGVPKKLLCEFEIYCNRDDALSRLNWTSNRPLFIDPFSEETLDFIRDCLESCQADHERCHPRGRVFPTRLLDVGPTIRLVDRPSGHRDPPKFLYLSACWGGDFALRLTRSNYSRLKTKITLEELPKTIRDAIMVAQALRIPYIWVDSLCVVQDDVESWSFEVTRLKDYLRSCTFTLGAASTRALAAGFLDLRDDRRCYTFNARTVGSLPGAKIHLRLSLPPVWNSLSRDPLFTRLWPLQELTLCSRSILFGSSRIVWNCQTHMISDASVNKLTPLWHQRLGFDMLLGDSRLSGNEILQSEGNKQELRFETLLRNQPIYNAWHKIVEASSQLKVTFDRDRLPALSALACVTQERLNGDEYLEGLWRNNLFHDLLWHRADASLKMIPGSSIPSWSWAAYSGRISYSMRDFVSPDLLDGLETNLCPLGSFVDVKSGKNSIDPFGQGEFASINIFTYCISYNRLLQILKSDDGKDARWEERLDSPNEITLLGHKIRSDPFETEADFDISTGPQWPNTASQASSLMVLAIASSHNRDWKAYMMLVVENVDGRTWRRVGVGVFFYPFFTFDTLAHFGFFKEQAELV